MKGARVASEPTLAGVDASASQRADRSEALGQRLVRIAPRKATASAAIDLLVRGGMGLPPGSQNRSGGMPPGVHPPGPQPVVPEKPQAKPRRAGWSGGFL